MKGAVMKKQNCDAKSEKIRAAFLELKKGHPEKLKRPLALSWSNWGFGMERLAVSAERLAKNGIAFIELHGNHYGPDLGYKPKETMKVLSDHGLRVGGICGMFSADSDMASNRAGHRQAAVDYIKREVPFAAEVGASYMLVVPAAVGRAQAYDAMELERSVETLQLVADLFVKHKVRAAIEPIRSAETTIVHTFAEAKRYIAAVGSPGVRHINGDVYHMQVEESHIGEAIVEAGEMLVNLHMADSNRLALGLGSMDLDTIIRALYLVGFNAEGRFVTPEPLGPGGDPYPAMYGKPDAPQLDEMVAQSARYFREREAEIISE
jgi:D-psicose/D-tagatose/L-ribulose 3-epimerase